MIAASEVRLEVAPRAVNRAAHGALFLHIMDAFLMQYRFQFSAELGTLQRLGREIFPEGFVLEVLADLLEALLPINGALDPIAERFFYYFVSQLVGFGSHRFPSD